MKPLVSISCITYNHVNYIKECLDGFLMQQCSFGFEVLIHDDASTDGTQEIIKEYQQKFPEIIKPILQTENQWSKGVRGINFRYNFTRAQGKYIALCEGDDYWTDPLKLQKQVDFLEAHPEYGLCYTRAITYHQDTESFKKQVGEAISAESILYRNAVPTLTTVFKKSMADEFYSLYGNHIAQQWKMGDYPLWIWFAFNSKVHFLDLLTSVYRIRGESMSHFIDMNQQLDFSVQSFKIADFFAKKYLNNKGYSKFVQRRCLSIIILSKLKGTRHYIDLMPRLYEYGKIKNKIKIWYRFSLHKLKNAI